MTYFLKRSTKPPYRNHIFSDENSRISGPVHSICECDNLEHQEFKFIQEGINLTLITCKNCLKLLSNVVQRELKKVLSEL